MPARWWCRRERLRLPSVFPERDAVYDTQDNPGDGVWSDKTLDPFGAFGRETILNYMSNRYEDRASGNEENKGGAGLGLFQIIESVDLFIINVKPKIKTEVIAIFNLDSKIQYSEKIPSFHYFSA